MRIVRFVAAPHPLRILTPNIWIKTNYIKKDRKILRHSTTIDWFNIEEKVQ